jgi:hypothetical protein
MHTDTCTESKKTIFIVFLPEYVLNPQSTFTPPMWLDVQGVDFQNHGDDFVDCRNKTIYPLVTSNTYSIKIKIMCPREHDIVLPIDCCFSDTMQI